MQKKISLNLELCLLVFAAAILSQSVSIALGCQRKAAEMQDAKSEGFALWYGVIETPLAHLRTIVKQNQPGQTPTAWLISPDQTAREFPMDSFVWEGETRKFECKQLGATYSGTVGQSGEIEGTFLQGGGEFRLALTPVNRYPPKEPRETWKGTLAAGPRKLELQFRVFDSPDKRDYVTFDSLNEGVKGLHAEQEREGDEMRFVMPQMQAEFSGQLAEDRETLIGTWKQGGAEFPFEMKLTKGDVKAARPQTPRPPFAYEVREVAFPGGNEETTLSGTLTIPTIKSVSKPFTAVVLVSGSGPQDRDETILEHRPFAVIADYLTNRGIAVLRYDDRGVGQSTGKFGTATTQDFAADARNAVEYLRTRPEIDQTKIGIIGHSEGGMVAPIVAAEHPQEIAFIVLLAGPGVPGSEIVKSQTQLMLAAAGADSTGLKQAGLISETLLESLEALPPDPTFELLATSVAEALYEKLPEDQRDLLFDTTRGETPSEQLVDSVRNGLRPVATPWYRYFIAYDPLPTLQRVECPVLALNGEKDLQVDAKLNLPPIKEALKHGESKTVSLPGLNHLFQRCETGALDEYYSIEQTMDPSVLMIIEQWITSLH